MTKATKEVLLNVRLREDTRDEFRVAAELRGATMSGLLHQFIVRVIREEKEREPGAFPVDARRVPVVHFEDESKTKQRTRQAS